ncbi:hypothetical protein [Oryzihumus sp.]
MSRPDLPPPPPGWRWWRRTRAGRVRLTAVVVGLALLVPAGTAGMVLGLGALMSDPAGSASGVVFVNDTASTWQVLACTGNYYPDAGPLRPGQDWFPEDWPNQDDPGAGCWLAPRDDAGHLGPGVCLAVPETPQVTFRVSRAHPSSLAACMDRSNPSL